MRLIASLGHMICYLLTIVRGVNGRMVTVVDFNLLVPHLLEVWILSCEEAIQQAYGRSVVLLKYPFVPEIMQGRAPWVFFNQ
jgi:hypothetical protein